MATAQTIARLRSLIWVLVYGGLITLVLGLSLQRTDAGTGWTLVVIGAAVAAIGFALIWVRSRYKVPGSEKT